MFINPQEKKVRNLRTQDPKTESKIIQNRQEVSQMSFHCGQPTKWHISTETEAKVAVAGVNIL